MNATIDHYLIAGTTYRLKEGRWELCSGGMLWSAVGLDAAAILTELHSSNEALVKLDALSIERRKRIDELEVVQNRIAERAQEYLNQLVPLKAEHKAIADQLEPPFDDSPLSERVAQLLRSYTELLKQRDELQAKFDGARDSAVDHPTHYNQGSIECIDALEAALGAEGAAAFCRGNAIKYLWRAGKKGDQVEDLSKARWYLEREISIRKRARA